MTQREDSSDNDSLNSDLSSVIGDDDSDHQSSIHAPLIVNFNEDSIIAPFADKQVSLEDDIKSSSEKLDENHIIGACEQEDLSLSSIGKESLDDIEGFASSDNDRQVEYRIKRQGDNRIEYIKPNLFTATNMLNIQENKFTPDYDDK